MQHNFFLFIIFSFVSSNLNPKSSLLRPRFAADASVPQPPGGVENDATTKNPFAVATSELFLGLAARLIKSSNGGAGDSATVAMFESLRKVYEEGIGAVVEDEIDPNVVWEQRVKDVETERSRYNWRSPWPHYAARCGTYANLFLSTYPSLDLCFYDFATDALVISSLQLHLATYNGSDYLLLVNYGRISCPPPSPTDSSTLGSRTPPFVSRRKTPTRFASRSL
ncbi:hypothetical protein Fmac_026553 [Flemingia macrophylla]|uniref:Uncharacterized protein n=1 Tax=Flemingia macrophylla TaxID=520843 RepID=A0ABD1LF71_9FABA